ncbi:MAG: hypothetical protein WKG00_15920 [Polyangiaceae bacterium]
MIVDPADLPLFTSPDVPRRFGELESALGLRLEGPLGPHGGMGTFVAPWGSPTPWSAPLSLCVNRLWAKYGWDPVRERPAATVDDLRHRMLVSFSVAVPRSWEICESLLRDRYGQATTATEVVETPEHRHATTYLLYGPFFTRPLTGGFYLDWYDRRPDWAAPPFLPEVRARWLRELTGRLRRAVTAKDMLRAIESPPGQAGITAGGLAAYEDASIVLVPAMRVTDLVEALSLQDACMESVGVHHETHRIVVGDPEGLGTSAPVFGAWMVDAALPHRAHGTIIESSTPTSVSRCRLDARDTVQYLQIRRQR